MKQDMPSLSLVSYVDPLYTVSGSPWADTGVAGLHAIAWDI